MNDLSPKATGLLDLGRHGDDPTDTEVSSNRRALAGKLGAATLGASAALGSAKQAAAATSVGTWTSAKVTLLCGAVIVGGAATWAIVQYDTGSSRHDARTVVAPPTVERPPSVVDERAESHPSPATLVEPDADKPAPPQTRSKPASAPRVPSISDELRLVRDAQQHLNRGEPAAALSLLSEHARRFPAGVLSEEREASRVLALCSLGQGEAARAQADDFIRRAPRSPFADRVRAACRSAPPASR
jgi:hypothetical protein